MGAYLNNPILLSCAAPLMSPFPFCGVVRVCPYFSATPPPPPSLFRSLEVSRNPRPPHYHLVLAPRRHRRRPLRPLRAGPHNRLKYVQECYDRQWRDACDDARTLDSKANTEWVTAQRWEQVAERVATEKASGLVCREWLWSSFLGRGGGGGHPCRKGWRGIRVGAEW